MGKARAMRSACNIPVNRWDEFVLTACYLSNQTPVTSQGGHTPFERWYGHKPDLSHLCEVGCRAFVLIQNRHNPKVFSRLVECVLIGYSLDSKAYRCYHRQSHKVFVSYHVSFIESHQHGTAPTSSLTTSPALPAPSIPQQLTVSIEEVHDVDVPSSCATVQPTLPPDLPRRSSWVPIPSECQCALDGKPYVSSTQ